jgi:hypothetical protein
VLARLVSELGDRSGAQIGRDEQQLGKIANVLLLEASPGRLASEAAIWDRANIELLGWHPPR